jgi:RNA polymerase sigma-70 factor (ECF subfamily)
MTLLADEVDFESPDALVRARSGDGDAFAELLAEHESMVYSLAYHFFNDRERAADIAQDVFLQLYRSLSGIDSPLHLVHWLRQVTTRRCIDQLRRRKGLRAVPIDEAEHLASPSGDPTLGRALRQLVATLPESQRLVVTLRYQEGLGPEEISRVAGMRLNTVKSHLHRALRALRRMLEER